MSLRIQTLKLAGTEPDQNVEFVELTIADGPTIEESKQWISARVKVDVHGMKSIALLELLAVRKVRDLLTDESDRLGRLYSTAEQSQR